MNIEQLSKFGTVKETGNYLQVLDGSLKKALIMKRKVHLEDSSKQYAEPSKMRVYSAEEIKKRHMGKIKCIVSYKSDEELATILSMYFS